MEWLYSAVGVSVSQSVTSCAMDQDECRRQTLLLSAGFEAVSACNSLVYDRSDEAAGHEDIGGLGDIEVAIGTAFRLSKTWRTGGGIVCSIPTRELAKLPSPAAFNR